MLERVVAALESSPRIARIYISIDAPEAVESVDELRDRIERGRLVVFESDRSPATSTLGTLDRLPDSTRLLVTTADHALLDRKIIEFFLNSADEGASDVAFAIVDSRQIRAQFPEAVRTYIAFRGARYSGANLFALRTANARRAVEFWTRAEDFRKHPWRLASTFGPVSLLLFALRRLRLEQALLRASRVIGAEIDAVDLPFAEAAIDVDRRNDHELVEQILAAQNE